ncbi:hypothetical protein QJQ45_027203 [Haematococcus lacustris]|nr:hypothetical protein QJQ45_027203 [Haematococcus lacustris]
MLASACVSSLSQFSALSSQPLIVARLGYLGCGWSSLVADYYPGLMLYQVLLLRHLVASRIVRMGWNVLSIDADVLFVTDPYREGRFALNSGTYYVRGAVPNGPVAYFLAEVSHRMLRHYEDSSQWLAANKLRETCFSWDQSQFNMVLSGMLLGGHILGLDTLTYCSADEERSKRLQPLVAELMEQRVYRKPGAVARLSMEQAARWRRAYGQQEVHCETAHLSLPRASWDAPSWWVKQPVYPSPQPGPLAARFLATLTNDSQVPLWSDPASGLADALLSPTDQAALQVREALLLAPSFLVGPWVMQGRLGRWLNNSLPPPHLLLTAAAAAAKAVKPGDTVWLGGVSGEGAGLEAEAALNAPTPASWSHQGQGLRFRAGQAEDAGSSRGRVGVHEEPRFHSMGAHAEPNLAAMVHMLQSGHMVLPPRMLPLRDSQVHGGEEDGAGGVDQAGRSLRARGGVVGQASAGGVVHALKAGSAAGHGQGQGQGPKPADQQPEPYSVPQPSTTYHPHRSLHILDAGQMPPPGNHPNHSLRLSHQRAPRYAAVDALAHFTAIPFSPALTKLVLISYMHGWFDWQLHARARNFTTGLLYYSSTPLRPIPRLIALHPSLPLHNSQNRTAFQVLLRGLAQVAVLANRTVLWPDVPCAAPWHCGPQGPGHLLHVPLDGGMGNLVHPYGSLGVQRCYDLRYSEENCMQQGRGMVEAEFSHLLHTVAEPDQYHPSKRNTVLRCRRSVPGTPPVPEPEHGSSGLSGDILGHAVTLPEKAVVAALAGRDEEPILYIQTPLVVSFDLGQPPEQAYQRFQDTCPALGSNWADNFRGPIPFHFPAGEAY